MNSPQILLLLALAQASGAVAAPSAYFPPELQKIVACPGRIPVLSDLESEWYSSQMAAAGEPSLYSESLSPRPAQAQTLRFTWLRSFDAPVVIRIEWAGSRPPHLIAKQLSGKGGYEPGTVLKQISRSLTSEEAQKLERLLNQTRVFDLPPGDCTIGVDGAEWVFEEVDRRGYHFVRRWSPQTGAVHELGLALLGLTGWRFDHIY